MAAPAALRGQGSVSTDRDDRGVSDYATTISLIERLHRRFLDVLRVELERLGIEDINNVQSLLLANIGEEQVSVGELMSRGYYLGSNVTYNLKRLVETGYVIQERSQRDRRVVRISLSPKGRELAGRIARMFDQHGREMAGRPGLGPLAELNATLVALEGFWSEKLAAKPALSTP
jgi:DNA-binding MarR family transcriptional regulator